MVKLESNRTPRFLADFQGETEDPVISVGKKRAKEARFVEAPISKNSVLSELSFNRFFVTHYCTAKMRCCNVLTAVIAFPGVSPEYIWVSSACK